MKAEATNKKTQDYPAVVCSVCGAMYGKAQRCNQHATWHWNECGVCGLQAQCTEPRDFGHLKDGWQERITSQ